MKKTLKVVLFLLVIVFLSGISNADNIIGNDNGKLVILNDSDKEKINTFLSNFSECFFTHFDKDKVNDTELITFAVLHNYKNNVNLSKGDSDNTVKISKDVIEKTIDKYFDIKFSNHSSVKKEEIEYRNEYYQIVAGVGEVIPFVQLTKIIDKGDQEFFVYGDEYINANYFSGNPYKPIDKWSTEEKQEVKKSGKIEALVKKIDNGITWRYILLKYNLFR